MIKFFLKTLLLALIFIGGKSFSEIRTGKEAFEVLKRTHRKDSALGASSKSINDILGNHLTSQIGGSPNLITTLLLSGTIEDNFEKMKRDATSFLTTHEAHFTKVLAAKKIKIENELKKATSSFNSSTLGQEASDYSLVAKTLFLLKWISTNSAPNDAIFGIQHQLINTLDFLDICKNPIHVAAADGVENVSRRRLRNFAKKTLSTVDESVESATYAGLSLIKFNSWMPNLIRVEKKSQPESIFEYSSKVLDKELECVKEILNKYRLSSVDSEDGIAYWNADILPLFIAQFKQRKIDLFKRIDGYLSALPKENIVKTIAQISDTLPLFLNPAKPFSEETRKSAETILRHIEKDKTVLIDLNTEDRKKLIRELENVERFVKDLVLIKEKLDLIAEEKFTGKIGADGPFTISAKALTLVTALAIFAGYKAIRAGKNAWDWFKKKKENKPEEVQENYQSQDYYYDDEY